ncbi:MAG TPA: ABC transporter substrate-binding protein [Oligoflexus sp.]|uniref:ABC transporter substrate-binding protein n=1 Tax=Oligoflexus sp. TaxID=1971216 RepID=UPI002D7E61CF|nr:ABC transporter substrate-binding protein [Oligoflexus sp.]HET9241032.1 ABC transporter substrate-binding protein [Oligoflexus sp.]
MVRLLLLVCLALGMPLQMSAQTRKLRVCVGDFPSYAIALDYLLDHKDDYEVSQTTVHACSVRFKKNYFDLIMADTYIFVTSDLEGVDSRIVSLVNYSDGVDQVLGQKGGNPGTLRGSRWALQRGTTSTVLLNFYLKSQGLSLRDVVMEDVKVENTPQAIGRTRFFGAVNWQPYSRQALARGAQVLATSADFPEKLYDIVVTRKSALDQHRPKIQAYVKERLQRARDKNRLYAAYAKLRGIPLPLVAQDFQGLVIFKTAAEVRKEQAKLLQSLRTSAEVADVMQYSGTSVQEQLKQREAGIFDFSVLE